jgi:hypothetical protein
MWMEFVNYSTRQAASRLSRTSGYAREDTSARATTNALACALMRVHFYPMHWILRFVSTQVLIH